MSDFAVLMDSALGTVFIPKTGVLVINLDRSNGRMAYQDMQMARLGLEMTRVRAVRKDDISDEMVAAYSARAVRPFRAVELACLLSHAQCWQRVVELGKPMLIVEDDVVLSDRLAAIIDVITQTSPNRIINLETFLDHPKYLSRRPLSAGKTPACEIFSTIKGTGGAAAYIIWPETADRLVKSLHKRAAIVELVLWRESGQRHLQTVPALAAQMMTLEAAYGKPYGETAQSTILTAGEVQERPDKMKRLIQKLSNPRYAFRRLRVELRVAFEKLAGTLFGQKLKIQPCPSLLARRD